MNVCLTSSLFSCGDGTLGRGSGSCGTHCKMQTLEKIYIIMHVQHSAFNKTNTLSHAVSF